MLAAAVVVSLGAAGVSAQAPEMPNAPVDPTLNRPQPPPQPPYVPIDVRQRIDWIVDGTVSGRSLCVGGIATVWQTGWDIPREWGRTWNGVGKRYVAREADVTISNAIEAGLGAIWGEEPRYIPAPRGKVRSRAGHAIKTVLLSQRRDGRLAPAWARYAGNVFNNILENQWLPPSVTTPRQTTIRSLNGLLGRLAGNLFEEFWPDIKARLRK